MWLVSNSSQGVDFLIFFQFVSPCGIIGMLLLFDTYMHIIMNWWENRWLSMTSWFIVLHGSKQHHFFKQKTKHNYTNFKMKVGVFNKRFLPRLVDLLRHNKLWLSRTQRWPCCLQSPRHMNFVDRKIIVPFVHRLLVFGHFWTNLGLYKIFLWVKISNFNSMLDIMFFIHIVIHNC